MELRVEAMPGAAIHCDANWVRQVVVGLIRNAIRHARDGGQIQLGGEVGAIRAGFIVSDNGPGFDPDVQATVFDRFVQGTAAGASQGFGIGLALAKWVIEAQDGEISLTSPLPRTDALCGAPGTKISVRLPRAPMYIGPSRHGF